MADAMKLNPMAVCNPGVKIGGAEMTALAIASHASADGEDEEHGD